MTSTNEVCVRCNVYPLVLRCLLGLFIGVGFLASGMPAGAQDSEGFTARLASAPPFQIPREAVAGIGSASAELTGQELVIAGSFQQLASPITRARVYIGPVTGVRGDPVFELTIVKGAGAGTNGGLTGSFGLTADQISALRDGRFHIQVHSEGAPAGHLLGWLLQ